MVFDKSASIRALLRRGIESAEGLASIGSFPVSCLLENGADLEEADALVIGLARIEEETWPALMAHVDRLGIPVIFLSPPGEPDLAASLRPERCLFMEKPRSPEGWKSLCSTLVAALKGMEKGLAGPNGHEPRDMRSPDSGLDLIAVGGSAGGPEATGEMLKTIGAALEKVAVVIVQHIGEGFESGYVQWLSRILPWTDVDVAKEGEALHSGRIRIAGPGAHLEISRGPALRHDRDAPPEHGHRPSVDRLFRSLARSKPKGSAGVLLSGMGVDGVEGLLRLNRAGCLTMVQDRESSAVFGMPRVALERGAATIAQPPEALGTVLRRRIEAGGRQ
ncbi:MAG: chemotaxis protein CheB [Acidobacteria bacterium]|nr:chemotaxis protein CheB [Acidobacteriota bacterium]